MRLREEDTENDTLEGKGHLLEKNESQDCQMGKGGRLIAAVAGWHIGMEARVVTSSWYGQIVVLPS